MIVVDPDARVTQIEALPSVTTLRRAAKAAQAAVELEGEVTVLLTDDAGIRRLNRRFRGKNKATDVLSFPAAEPGAGPSAGPSFGVAGDLAISVETAARQAAAEGHRLSTELRVLLLHGMLHLAGMDHESDSGEMAAREAELRRTLRLPLGLIERVCAPRQSGQGGKTRSNPGGDAGGGSSRASAGQGRAGQSRAGRNGR